MQKVLLYEHVGLGLVISWPSGITYSNQAGGYSCAQPSVEGVFVPLRNDCSLDDKLLSPETELLSYFTGSKHRGAGTHGKGFDQEDADFIDGVLKKYNLARCLRVDRSRLGDCDEAWVPVEVIADEDSDGGLFSGFAPYPRPGVLTWTNSD